MIYKSLYQQADDILDTLYEAADVPHINRRHIGRQFMELLEQLVDQTVTDYMESAHDPMKEIRDLETRVDEMSDKINQMKQALDEIACR